MSSISSSSRSSFSSAEPSTPHSAHLPSPFGPSSSYSSATPPGSLRDYTASLKSRHALGMAQAMKSIPLEPYCRGSDPHQSQADDNPFDLLYSPTPKPRSMPHATEFGALRPQTTSTSAQVLADSFERRARRNSDGVGLGRIKSPHQDMDMEVDMVGRGINVDTDLDLGMDMDSDIDIELSPTKQQGSTGVIPFTRSDSYHLDSTPMGSDSSFEASAPGDYFRVYGHESVPPHTNCSDSDYSPFGLSPYLRDSPQIPPPFVSSASGSSSMTKSDSSPLARQAPVTDGFFEPASHRSSIMSTSTTSSTITASSRTSTNTVTPLGSSLSTATLASAQILPVTVAKAARPSLLRPRPRPHPYDTAMANGSGASGGRQRETSGGSNRSVNVSREEEQQMKEDGRSYSEIMVAMAGLQCQRGRGVQSRS